MSDPRGIRLNNPGNLKKVEGKLFLGEVHPSRDPIFREFETLYYGTRALMKQVIKLVLSGNIFIPDLIHVWAPHSENDTDEYVNAVCEWTSMTPVTVIAVRESHITPICRAICRMEQGKDILVDTDLTKAWEDLV